MKKEPKLNLEISVVDGNFKIDFNTTGMTDHMVVLAIASFINELNKADNTFLVKVNTAIKYIFKGGDEIG